MKYKRRTRIFLYFKLLLLIIVLILIGVEAFFYFSINDMVNPHKKQLSVDLNSLLIDYINVELKNEEGQKLVGWLLLNKKSSNKAVLMLPGYNSNKAELVNAASKIYDLGYSVLLVDLRGQGESEGDKTTFGLREKDDIICILTYLVNDNRVKANTIAIWADDISAYASLLALKKFPQVRLLLLNNVFPEPVSYIRGRLSLPFKVPDFIIDYIVYQNVKSIVNDDPKSYDLKDILPIIKGRTIIFFKTDDPRYNFVKNLYDIAPERKELIILKETGARALNGSDWEEYYKLIEEKLNTYFPLSEQQQVVSLTNE